MRLWLLAAIVLFIPSTGRAQVSAQSLALDIRLLHRMKVVRDDAYWLRNAEPGRVCDGEAVRILLVSMAKMVDRRHGSDQPLQTLMSRKIIWNDYWEKNAVPGKQCNGEYVGNLIHAAADVLGDIDLVRRYRVPRGVISQPYASAFAPLQVEGRAPSFNTILGTQSFSPSYGFTRKTRLVETAEAIRDMGSHVIKFDLSARYRRDLDGVDAPMADIHSLTELARDEPSHRRVLDMPFAHFVLWAHTFSVGESKWRHGFAKADQQAEYREIYDLARYLLTAYNGTGKTFYLGHWEGDGLLRGSVAPENDAKVTPIAVQGMADWLNTRQRAVDDAKRETPHAGVQIWNYTEVNHVKLAMQGRPALVNEVLPKTNVDLVSYSSYDTASDPQALKRALSFIESKLPAKPGFTGRRVFIGEYGFPAISYPPADQDRMSRGVMRAGIEWGCPLILYWEMYNNEVEPGGKQRGFWLIDDKDAKQPVYNTHHEYFEWARRFIAETTARTGRLPTNDAFRRASVEQLTGVTPPVRAPRSSFAPLPPLRHPIAVIAHRAGRALSPENTLGAIRKAISLGVDYVELDIRATKDGQLVIMHDGSVDRTTNGHGAVKDLTLAEIRALDAGSKFDPKYAGEKVPTFEEVLKLCKGKVCIYVDHKQAPTEQVLALIRKFGMEKRVVVYNGPRDLLEWKKIAPSIPVMPSLPDEYRRPGGIAEFEKLLPAEVLDGNLVEWTKELVDQCHALGVKVYVDNLGPNDNPDGFRKAIDMGVDGIQTDHPDMLVESLRAVRFK